MVTGALSLAGSCGGTAAVAAAAVAEEAAAAAAVAPNISAGHVQHL